MKGVLTQSDIEDLLVVCGTEPRYWNAHGEMQVCCPVHGERNPSMGVSSEKQLAHCFSCGFAGDFPWLLFNSQPDQFPSYQAAREFIESEYDASFVVGEKAHNIIRYEDSVDCASYKPEVTGIPIYKLAPFKSGKETYKYFFLRGFSKEEMQEYMIGRDTINKTVTIPVFSEDNKLLGIIGRFISKDRKKNERYKIYDNFKRGDFLFPLNKYKEVRNTIILVEGQFDAMRLHMLGYTNALAKMGVSVTKKQANWVVEHCDRVIDLVDNDSRGLEALEADRETFAGRVTFLDVTYPDYGKDVCDWDADDIKSMISGAGHRSRVHRYI